MKPPRAETRFVVLHHTGWGQEHLDLMIEPAPGAQKLHTWRVPCWPLRDGVRLTPLGEHRREYLEYEGPVSGGRGEVRCVARGLCAISSGAEGAVRVKFEDEEWLLSDVARRG